MTYRCGMCEGPFDVPAPEGFHGKVPSCPDCGSDEIEPIEPTVFGEPVTPELEQAMSQLEVGIPRRTVWSEPEAPLVNAQSVRRQRLVDALFDRYSKDPSSLRALLEDYVSRMTSNDVRDVLRLHLPDKS